MTNEWNANDRDNFSHAIPRRLARGRADGCGCLGGRRHGRVSPKFREDTRASQLVDPHIGKEGFLDLFGRPARESSCECERRSDFSLPQALNLVNGTNDFRCRRRSERARGEADFERQERRGHRGRAVSCGAEPPADAGGARSAAVKYLSDGSQSAAARRISCGRCSTAKISVHLLRGGRRSC